MSKSIFKAVFMLFITTAFAIQDTFGSSITLESTNLPDKHLTGFLKGILTSDFNYIVDDGISIKRGDTLIIEAGATVNFRNKIGFEVKGKLIAKGDELRKIVFTCLDSEFSWRGISFLENAPSPDLSFCLFRNTVGLDNFRGALSFIHSEFEGISNCTFLNNDSGAIYLKDVYEDSISISGNTFENCEDFGISFTHGSITSSFKCYNNTFSGKEKPDIGFTGFRMLSINECALLDFKGNKFTNCSYNFANATSSVHPAGAILIDDSNFIQAIQLDGDIIERNTVELSSIFINPSTLSSLEAKNIRVVDNIGEYGGVFIRSNSTLFDNCTFQNNSGGGAITFLPSDSQSKFQVANSFFGQNSNGQTEGGAIRILGSDSDVDYLNIINCEFKYNSSSNGGAIFAKGLKSLNSLLIDSSSFEYNEALSGNGGVLSFTGSGLINTVSFKNSKKILGNHSNRNGGVFSFTDIGMIENFNYEVNTHGLGKENYTDKDNSGNGGIGNINVGNIRNISIADNKSIFSSADQNGGAFSLQTNSAQVSSNVKISIIRNEITGSTNAIKGFGGFSYLSGNINGDFIFSGNTLASSKAGIDGGTVYFQNPSGILTGLEYSGNSVESSLAAGSGGLMYYEGAISGAVKIEANTKLNSASGTNGGAFYINNTDVIGLSGFSIINNKQFGTFVSANGSGGLLYYTGKANGNLTIRDNIIASSTAGKNGGTLCFENLAGGKLANLEYSTNDVKTTSLGGSGGLLYYAGAISGLVKIEKNTKLNSNSMNDGGAFCIKNTVANGLLNFNIADNVFGNIKSSDGSGGLIYYEGDGLTSGDFIFTGNSVAEASSKGSGGSIYYKNQNGIFTNLEYSNNDVKTTSVGGSGGLMYSAGAISGSINITGNKKLNSTSSLSGGAFFFNNNDTNGLSGLNINDNNQFEKTESLLGAGGLLYYTGNVNNCVFNFKSNTITSSSAKTNGGTICFENINGKVSDFSFSGNTITSTKSENSGGLMYYNGAISGTIKIEANNKLNSTAGTSGGAFYINNTDLTGLTGFSIINNNQLGIFESAKGSGGFLYYSGKASSDFIFSGNTMASSKAGIDGGTVYFKNPSGILTGLEYSGNSVESSLAAGSGGLMYYEGAISGAIKIEANTKLNSTSGTNGGAFYINNTDVIGLSGLSIINNKQFGTFVSANGSGGLLYYTGKANGNLAIKDNIIASSTAGKNGGTLCFENLAGGKLANLEYSNNDVKTTSLGGSGGLLYYAGAISGLVKIEKNTKLNSNSMNDGGAFCIKNTVANGLLNFNIADNVFGNIKSSDGSGGLLYYEGDGLTSGDFIFTGNSVAEASSKGSGGSIYYKNQNGIFTNLEYSNNDVKTSSVGGLGGLMYYSGAISGNVKIEKNTKLNSIALNDGGAFYINNTIKNSLINFSLDGNAFGNLTSSNGSGGLLYYEGTGITNGDFIFKDNTLSEASSKGSGGTIFFKNLNGSLTNLKCINNSVTSKSIGDGGGFISYNGGITNSVVIKQNSSLKANSFNNGGAFSISNNAKNGLVNFEISGNTIESISSNGSGGFVHYNGSSLDQLTISANSYLNSCFANGNGGVYNYEAGYINHLDILTEKINSTEAAGNGGFCAVFSDSISTFNVSGIEVKEKAKAKRNGGLAYIKVINHADQLKLTNNTFAGVLEANSGAFLSFEGVLKGNSNVFTVNGNTINSVANVVADGGLIHFNGSLNQNFEFNSNKIKNNVNVGGNGGILCIKNNGGDSKSITISNNLFDNPKSDLVATNGGVLYVDGIYKLENVSIQNNDFLKYNLFKVSKSGGLVFVKNSDDQNEIKVLDFSGNKMNSLRADSVGGLIFGEGSFSELIRFNGNSINRTVASSGGVIEIINTSKTGLSKFEFSKGKIAESIASKGNGALVNYNAGLNTIGSLVVSENTVGKAESGNTGAFSFHTGNLNRFLSTKNSFSGTAVNSGGIYYFNAPQITSTLIEDDNFIKCMSTGSGAGVFFDVMKMDSISFISTKIKSNSALFGGFGSFKDGIAIKNLEFLNSVADSVQNCYADLDGGVLYIKGTIDSARVVNNYFYHNYSGRNGGLIYFEDVNGLDRSSLIFANDSCKNNDDLSKRTYTSGGNGGVLYLKNISKVKINDCKFDGIFSKNSGGAVFVSAVNEFKFTNNESYNNRSNEGFGGVVYLTNANAATFNGNIYFANYAESGGSLYFKNGNIQIDNDEIDYNTAKSKAGGFYISEASGGIKNSIFQKNELQDTYSDGGGLFLIDLKPEGISLLDNTFKENSSYKGSAVFLENSKSRFTRNKFIQNKSNGAGAVYFNAGSSDSWLVNCLFYQNDSKEATGSAIMVNPLNQDKDANLYTFKITNCTIYDHNYYGFYVEPKQSPNTYQIANSILHLNNYGSKGRPQYKVPENIKLDLEYSNIENLGSVGNFCISTAPKIEKNSFCLEFNSVCKDVGNPDPAFNDRAPLIFGGLPRNDMGITGGPDRFDDCNSILRPEPSRITNSESTSLTQSFDIFPNPATKVVNLKVYIEDEEVLVELLSMLGKVLHQSKLTDNYMGKISKLDIPELPKGPYILRVVTKTKSYTKQLIII